MSDGSTAHRPLDLLLRSRDWSPNVRLDACEFQVEHWPLTSNASMCDLVVARTQFGSLS